MTDRIHPRPAKVRADHDRLLRPLTGRPTSRLSGRPLDAIIVPASRRAQHLRGLVDLAARYGTTLVVLASHDCNIDEVAALVAGSPGGGRAVLVKVPLVHDSELLRLTTSDEEFRFLNGQRQTNLSLKRNIGLLLARLRGWNKIMFVDDDIIGLTQEQLSRVAHHLDSNRFAGCKTVSYPDNSVVCHANRLIGRPQGIFVSGAALGVNTAQPLEVFPEIYNEDWFAFAEEAANSGVAHVGDIRQLKYHPFADPQRAVHEEFGDLLAEGLYAMFSDHFPLSRATVAYWERFIEGRQRFVGEIRRKLEDMNETHEVVQAAKSLQAAQNQLDYVRAAGCKDFVDAWQLDRRQFDRRARRLPVVGDYADAFAVLGLTDWQEARFGIPRMPTLASLSPVGGRR
jgi:hypothetical protein